MSCSPVYDERVMDVYNPQWASLLADSKRARVVACDVLVTYEGSTLDNAGSIAAGNVDGNLLLAEEQTLYSKITSLPFDKYRGRLASAGQAEGGAHWHYIPNHDDELSGDLRFLDGDSPMGVIAITGLLPGQPVRIEAHYIVNFYSQLPQYSMRIPPPMSGFSPLLWILRTEVPLVSSNDTHKIVKALKRGVRNGVDFVTDPRVIKALSMLAGIVI
jgi:hypothetical protein